VRIRGAPARKLACRSPIETAQVKDGRRAYGQIIFQRPKMPCFQ
jgi:hypothetical protein